MKNNIFWILAFILLTSCHPSLRGNAVPVIGFLDALEDETISQAKKGFFDALRDSGYSEDMGNIKIIYRNAQGDIPTLTQACDYFISENVDIIAANATISTITATQKTSTIPVCMMVSPTPELMHLTDKDGKAPANLFGVYENLDYIDSAIGIIQTLFPKAKRLGVIYNQSEPQSISAFEHIKKQCSLSGLELISLPVNSSSETQMVTQSILNKGVDAFFAMPDNTVFASFEVIAQSCNDAKIPVFTGEEGLVKRGSLAAFGADMYQWGYQAGGDAIQYLRTKKIPSPELVKRRKRLINSRIAEKFGININSITFTPI